MPVTVTADDAHHKLESRIFTLLCNADGSTTTARKQHLQYPDSSCFRLTYEAPKVEVLQLANKILVHPKSTLVHKVCYLLVQINIKVLHIHIHPVIRGDDC